MLTCQRHLLSASLRASACAVTALSGAAAAHDSWLVAEANTAVEGEEIRLAFLSGETFPASEHATDPGRVADWLVVHGDLHRRAEAYDVEGLELVTNVRMTGPGMHVAAVVLRPRYIELEAAVFTSYLDEERATDALIVRRQSGEEDQPGRERYSKHAKTFVEVGGVSSDSGYQIPVGHTLEIMPLSNPCRWNIGDEVLVRVLLEGEPVSAARVSSAHEDLPPHTFVQHETTDDQGVARLKLTRPGLWFMRTHAIRRAAEADQPPAEAGEQIDPVTTADWESFWATITFRVAGPN